VHKREETEAAFCCVGGGLIGLAFNLFRSMKRAVAAIIKAETNTITAAVVAVSGEWAGSEGGSVGDGKEVTSDVRAKTVPGFSSGS
jgi:hypothetical protein